MYQYLDNLEPGYGPKIVVVLSMLKGNVLLDQLTQSSRQDQQEGVAFRHNDILLFGHRLAEPMCPD
jgi:hypothetical protein